MASGVEFDEDNTGFAAPRPAPTGGVPTGAVPTGPASHMQSYMPVDARNEPGMVQWLIRKHIVKTAKGAQAILLILVVINIIITFVLIKFFT